MERRSPSKGIRSRMYSSMLIKEPSTPCSFSRCSHSMLRRGTNKMWKSRAECSLSSLKGAQYRTYTLHANNAFRKSEMGNSLYHCLTPEYILSNDVHKLQPWTDKKDDVFDISRGEPAALEGKHLFNFMFLKIHGSNHTTQLMNAILSFFLLNELRQHLVWKRKRAFWIS